jgi:hypothetical protein
VASVTEYVDDGETIAELQALVRFHTENPPGNAGPAASHPGLGQTCMR